jgi:predicted RecB family nuclease
LGILLKRCFIFPRKSYALKDLGSFLEYNFKYPELDGLMVALGYHRHVEENEPLDPKILEYNEDDVKVLPHMIDKLTSGKFSINKVPYS